DVWDLNTTANWTDGSIAEKYFDLDSVSFGNGPSNRNITINGTVAPASITMNNNASNDYTFNGGTIADSGLVGGTSFTKSGAGKLTLNNNSTYAGPSNIKEGMLVMGSFSALPSGTVLTLGDTSTNTSAVVDLG